VQGSGAQQGHLVARPSKANRTPGVGHGRRYGRAAWIGRCADSGDVFAEFCTYYHDGSPHFWVREPLPSKQAIPCQNNGRLFCVDDRPETKLISFRGVN